MKIKPTTVIIIALAAIIIINSQIIFFKSRDIIENQAYASDSQTTSETTTAQTTAQTTARTTTGTTAFTPAPIPGQALAIPVGGTAEQVVTYYNNLVNGVCDDTAEITKTVNLKAEIVEMPAVMKVMMGSQLDEMTKTEPTVTTRAYTNGVSADGKTIGEFMPRGNGTPSELTAAGVTAATVTQNGSDYTLTLNIVDETVNSIGEVPVHHNACMDDMSQLNDNILNAGDETVESSAAEEGLETSTKIDHENSVITAVFSSDGTLKTLNLKTTMTVTMEIKAAFMTIKVAMQNNIDTFYEFRY